MQEGLNYAARKVKEFHEPFGHPISKEPLVMSRTMAQNRTNWTVQENVEFLYATHTSDNGFLKSVEDLKEAIDKESKKCLDNSNGEYKTIVGQVDALIDNMYFVLGSFVAMGLEPQPFFDIVHNSNMAKLGEDGKPRYNEDGKILKPDGWEENYAPEPLIEKEIERQRNSTK